MLLLAAAAIAASTPIEVWRPNSRAVVQASATVRIVVGARVQFDRRTEDLPRVRTAQIRTADGPKQAQLIEFE